MDGAGKSLNPEYFEEDNYLDTDFQPSSNSVFSVAAGIVTDNYAFEIGVRRYAGESSYGAFLSFQYRGLR